MGMPVAGHSSGFGAVTKSCAIARPALPNKSDKLAIDLFWRPTAFAPVENELRANSVDELGVDPSLRHDIHGIWARLPLIIKSRGLVDLKGLMRALLPAPGT